MATFTDNVRVQRLIQQKYDVRRGGSEHRRRALFFERAIK
jgi:hypothetical protein